MPEPDGLACAKIISEIAPRTFILFATAFDRFMDKAFELYAFDYLLKPFKAERVAQTLARIRTLIGGRDQRTPAPLPRAAQGPAPKKLMLKGRESVVFVDLREILLIQRENRSTVLYTLGGTQTTSESLSALEARLDPSQFSGRINPILSICPISTALRPTAAGPIRCD